MADLDVGCIVKYSHRKNALTRKEKYLYLTDFKGVLKSKTAKSEIFLPVKELVLIDKYTPSIRFWSL